MKKNKIVYAMLAIIIGVILGKNIYDGYALEMNNISKLDDKNVYLMQYGVYSNENSMIDNTKELKNYFYYKENDKYHVLIGIIADKSLQEKIKNAYGIKSNIYLKKVNIQDQTFLETLNQYDKLLKELDDDTTIINAEKQVLSKYDEIVLRNELNAN